MSSNPTYRDLECCCNAELINCERLSKLVQILQHQAPSSKEFLDYALDRAIALTKSRIGYIYWYDEDRREFVLNTWSKEVLKECAITDPPTRYDLDKTGIWGEAVRQRKPIILNDYSAEHPLKRGYPEGHARLRRFLTVPVFSDQRIVAVVGVANKESDYTTTDVLQLTLLMDGVWKAVDQKRIEERLRKSEERRRLAMQGADLGTWDWNVLSGDVAFNRRWVEMLGYELSEVQPSIRSWENLIHPDDLPGVKESVEKHLRGEADAYETEHRLRHKSGRWVWVLDKGRVIKRDADGRALRVCGTHLDITARKRAEATVRLQADQYASILSTTTDGFWLLDEAGRLLDVNDGYCRMSGYAREELLSMEIGSLEAAETRTQTAEHIRRVIDQGSDQFETRHRARDGRMFDVEVSTSYCRSDHRFVAFLRDVTERKQAEQKIRESRQFLRTTMDSLTAHVCVVDAAGVILDVNRAWLNFAAANPPVRTHVFEGANYLEVCDAAQGPDAETAHAFAEGLRAVLAGRRKTFDLEYPCHSPGEQRWFIGHVTRFGGPGLSYAVVAHENITERKRVESALAESERRLVALIGNLPGVAYRCRFDRDWTMLFISEGIFELAGCLPSDLLLNTRLSYADLIHPDDREYVWESINQALSESRHFVLEYRVKPIKGGEEKWVWERGHAVTGLSGEIEALEGFITDITERKRLEMARQASQQLLEGILNTIPARVFWKDKNLNYLGCNTVFAQDAGFPAPKDLIGKDDYGMAWRDQADLYREDDRQVIEAGRPKLLIEEPQVTPDGRTITLLTNKTPLRDAEGKIIGVLGAYMDITERKNSEKEILESEERNRRLIESSSDAIIVRSNEIIQYANPAAIRLFGAARMEELVGRPYLDLVHPDDRAGTVERVRKAMEENWTAPPREHRILTLGGTVVDVESTGVPVQHHGETQIFGIFRDITERRKAVLEKEMLEAQLRQAQKMEAIGTLAGGIAHDFNNILGVIIGNSELLALRDEAGAASEECLDQVLAAAQRAKQLVNQILTFSRRGEQQKLLLSLKSVVKETLGFLRASLPTTIQLQHFIAPNAGVTLADPTQMQQVLMNICTNAAHAMERHGGVLKIDLRNAAVTEGDVIPRSEPGHRNYVVLTVSDTGHGMDPEVQARIFDPYFTTKEPGKGTGLGLSVVHGIVQSHGGAIQVISEVGKGSTFKVFLPRADPVEEPEPACAQTLANGSEKILLVDDEAALAEVGKQMLEFLGYQVEARTNPVEALELLRAEPNRFDAVITDMTMPRMTGMNLAREILAIRPGIATILCTGFSDQADEEKAQSAGIRALLYKPLTMQGLATAVRAALECPVGQSAMER